MIRDYLPALASVVSTITVFLLGRVIVRGEKLRESNAAIEVAEIEDRAKLTGELWIEIKNLRDEIDRLRANILQLQKDNLDLSVKLAKAELLLAERENFNRN